jgi:hypothetical protein
VSQKLRILPASWLLGPYWQIKDSTLGMGMVIQTILNLIVWPALGLIYLTTIILGALVF